MESVNLRAMPFERNAFCITRGGARMCMICSLNDNGDDDDDDSSFLISEVASARQFFFLLSAYSLIRFVADSYTKKCCASHMHNKNGIMFSKKLRIPLQSKNKKKIQFDFKLSTWCVLNFNKAAHVLHCATLLGIVNSYRLPEALCSFSVCVGNCSKS